MESPEVTDRFRGLNMNHGFIKSIVRNQIDRDEYHKIMEERRQDIEKKIKDERKQALRGSSRSQPENGVKLYIPPHLRNGNITSESKSNNCRRIEKPSFCPVVVNEIEENTLREKARNRIKSKLEDVAGPSVPQSSSSEKDSKRVAKTLFRLVMKDTEGKDFEVAVMDTDNACRLAKELGRKHGFSEEQSRMLRLTLEKELDTRLAVS